MKKILGLLMTAALLAACSGPEGDLMSKAKRLSDKGEYAKAIHVYSQVIKQNPANFAAYANRGLLYERLKAQDAAEMKKNKQLAQRDYEAALALDYQSPEVLNNLAALYIDTGNYEDAIVNLDEALALKPNYEVALLNRGIAYTKQHNFNKALIDFSALENLNERFPLLYLNRGIAHYLSGYYEGAVDDYTTLAYLEPNNPRAYIERGRTFIKMEHFQNAVDDFQQAIAINPNNAMPYFYIGELLFSHGDTDEGIGYMEQAKKLAPKSAFIYDTLGDMLALDSPVEATQHYLAARRLDPKHEKRYEAKIRLMTTENGRKRVVASRFMNLSKKSI